MKFHKLISVLLHPIVLPTIGVLLYFILIPIQINRQQQYALLGIVFISTYIIPILLLVFLKALGYIKSYQVETIKERKIPLFFMITLFFILGKTFYNLANFRDLSFLFYGATLGLLTVYFLSFFRIKTSLHLISMGNAVGFLLVLALNYQITILPIIMVLIVLSGFLASARLHLKAHIPKEIYIGFLLGIVSQFAVFYFL